MAAEIPSEMDDQEDELLEDFRARARECLAAAQAELASGDESRLPYAALRLRMALEALTYERAHAYRKFLAPGQCEAWQPKRIIDTLLNIDPHADRGRTLYSAPATEDEAPTADMDPVGIEHVISLRTLKKHYDALGSFLHLPTLRQLRQKQVLNLASLQKHCQGVIEAIEKALSSTIFNVVASVPFDFPCERCGEKIIRCTPFGPFQFETSCSACKATYGVSGAGDGRITMVPLLSMLVPCKVVGCTAQYRLWLDQSKLGHEWMCVECGANYRLNLSPKLLVGEGDSA